MDEVSIVSGIVGAGIAFSVHPAVDAGAPPGWESTGVSLNEAKAFVDEVRRRRADDVAGL